MSSCGQRCSPPAGALPKMGTDLLLEFLPLLGCLVLSGGRRPSLPSLGKCPASYCALESVTSPDRGGGNQPRRQTASLSLSLQDVALLPGAAQTPPLAAFLGMDVTLGVLSHC